MTIREFVDRTWWTTNIAIIDANDPRRKGDITLKEAKEMALYYGTADDCRDCKLDEEMWNCEVDGVGVIKGRLIIMIIK